MNTNEPLFVIRLDAEKRQVVVGTEAQLSQTEVHVGGIHFVSGMAPMQLESVTAKIRYSASAVPGVLEVFDKEGLLHLSSPQRAVTPGQAAVFYRGDEVIGGGFII